jgi:hypothetical protein
MRIWLFGQCDGTFVRGRGSYKFASADWWWDGDFNLAVCT